MKNGRIDIGTIRRGQIVEAAVQVIAERGLENLSLSEIEKKAGMSRGHLMYYFPTKEAILLAVFDRVLTLMYERVGTPAGLAADQAGGWQWIEHLFARVVGQAPVSPEFHCLQYTFLSQLGHRHDFRRRLAVLYEEWRSNMARGLKEDFARNKPRRKVPPRALATLVQALLHGLAMQAAAAPDAFDRGQMLHLCLDLLGTYLWGPRPRRRRTPKKSAANGRPRQRTLSPRRGGR
jgi:AcrR family transcriptional regulator